MPTYSGDAKKGDTLIYLLRPQDNPTQPERLWHGRILEIVMDTSASPRFYRVQSLEYSDCDEEVYPEQVVAVEPPLIEPGLPQRSI